MNRVISSMEGDEVILNIEIDPEHKTKDWCVTITSKSNYGSGFDIPNVSKILEYPFKVDTICGNDNKQISKRYTMPGSYLGILEVGSEPISIAGSHITRFEVTGISISDKDIKSARELLACMAEIYEKNKQKGETVFINMMLNPFFDSLVSLLENVANKKDIYPYVDNRHNNITLFGPAIEQGKYVWPELHENKYILRF